MLNENTKDSGDELGFVTGEADSVIGSERNYIPVEKPTNSNQDTDTSLDLAFNTNESETPDFIEKDSSDEFINSDPELVIDNISFSPSDVVGDAKDDELSRESLESDGESVEVSGLGDSASFPHETNIEDLSSDIETDNEFLESKSSTNEDDLLRDAIDMDAAVKEIINDDFAKEFASIDDSTDSESYVDEQKDGDVRHDNTVEDEHQFTYDSGNESAVEAEFPSSPDLGSEQVEIDNSNNGSVDAFDMLGLVEQGYTTANEEAVKTELNPTTHDEFTGNDGDLHGFGFGEVVEQESEQSLNESTIDEPSLSRGFKRDGDNEVKNSSNEHNTVMGNVKTTIIASVVSAVIAAGAMFAVYEFGVKGDINSKVDEYSYTQKMQTLTTKVSGLEKIVKSQNEKLKTYATASELNNLSGKISGLANRVDSAAEERSIKNVESKIAELAKEQRLSKETLSTLSDKLEWSVAKISSSDANSADYKQALKYIVSLKKLVDKTNHATMTKIGKISKELNSSIDKVRDDLGKNKKALSGLKEQLSITKKSLTDKISAFAAPTSSEAMPSQSLSSALGINIDKGAAKPVYQLRGIFNGTLFVDMPKAGTGEYQVTAKKVGDYLDGYGKILSINPSTKIVKTESGVVVLVSPSA